MGSPIRRREDGAIALAEKVLSLLDEGSFTTTYKYAVLLGLIDVCMENTSRTGEAPDVVTTRQLAEKVLEIYWPQAVRFHYESFPEPTVLNQYQGARDAQAAILSEIVQFRSDHASDPSAPLPRARRSAPEAFEDLVQSIEWKLIEMPLPRLQYFGRTHDDFLYSISWDKSVRVGDVSEYQRSGGGPFDNRISLKPRVGEYLVLLNSLLRPLIHRQWAAMVAQLNDLEESRLEQFLFGARRIPLDPVRPGLRALQEDRCFYCGGRLRSSGKKSPEVDHFIPWARYPNNAIENLVVAHERCNSRKSDFLAAPGHLDRWADRFEQAGRADPELQEVAADAGWESDPGRSLSVTRAVYLRLPADARLWREGREFVEAEPEELETVLA